MRKRWYQAVLATVAMAVLALAGTAASAGPSTPDDRPAETFDAILRAQADAWFAEDGAAFAATFWPDGDMVTFNGDHLNGRADIAVRMQYYFDNYMDPTHIKTLSQDVTFARPDLAVIVRTSCLLVTESSPCRDGSLSTNTNVMLKRHGRWMQQSFQNTRQMPLG
ncbi:hypothetical protein Afil01_03060 [Actinorhabdospora filicis]|uniref:DUF4440 domain-containing protein n=1 Tax=Actinorhabdospora filicis TaxID=1785913 RepID=A0A9W6W6F0_9ACTN|nr:SgcJ/EcaC family oxidoreductase [Actinorhabdospora filicis]GLZ75499.1 hypothetical protein Afil01_03060 [Actinorhabdospora filicis]